MTTVTLVRAVRHDANHIHTIIARPMNVHLTGLAGGVIQFSCTNPVAHIRGAKNLDIVYGATAGGGHENIEVSSVIS